MKLQTASIEHEGLPREDGVLVISIEPFFEEARPQYAAAVEERFPGSSAHMSYFSEKITDYMNIFHETLRSGDASEIAAIIATSQRTCTRDIFE